MFARNKTEGRYACALSAIVCFTAYTRRDDATLLGTGILIISPYSQHMQKFKKSCKNHAKSCKNTLPCRTLLPYILRHLPR